MLYVAVSITSHIQDATTIEQLNLSSNNFTSLSTGNY